MKKFKKVILLGIALMIIGIFWLTSGITENLLKDEVTGKIQAYNHNPSNILENVFEKDGKTILPFIFENSKNTITKLYIMEQFEAKGLKIENGEELGDIIVTGDIIKTNSKEYHVLIYGDVNKDGEVDVMDADFVFRHYFNEENYKLEDVYKIAGNVSNEDNDVDVIDAQRIFEFYFGFETRLVINEPDSSKIPEEPDEPEKPEIKAPEIMLKGENPQTIKIGQYIELGATAKDYEGKTLEVKIDSSSIKDEEGEYTVIYTAVDDKGQETIVTRKVKVIDYVTGIIAETAKVQYEYGENLDISKITVKEIMKSGKEGATLNASQYKISDYDPNKSGIQTLKVTYETNNTSDDTLKIFEDTITLIVKPEQEDPEAPEITLKGDNPQTIKLGKYVELGATAKDFEGNEIPQSNIKIDISGIKDRPGEYEVIYTAVDNDGKVAIKTRTVIVEDYVDGIRATATKLEYQYGEKLDISKIVVKESMKSGKDGKTLNSSQYKISKYDPTKVGTQTLTVKYTTTNTIDGSEKTFEDTIVLIVKPEPKAPELTLKGANPQTIKIGQYIELGASAKNYAGDEIPQTSIKIDKSAIKDEPGEYEVVYTVEDKATGKKTTIKRKVIVQDYVEGITISTTKSEYQYGEDLDTSKIVVKEVMKSKKEGLVIDSSKYIILGNYDPNKVGVQTIKIAYTTTNTVDDTSKTFEGEINVTVKDPVLKVNDGTKDITNITLYTKQMPGNNYIDVDALGNVYTLIPIALEKYQGTVEITADDIVTKKTEGKISIIDNKVDTNVSLTSQILVKTYKKSTNNTFTEITDSTTGSKEIDYIGIAINKNVISSPEAIEYIKLYYGNATEASVTLMVNSKITKTNLDELSNIQITVNQEIKKPLVFYSGEEEVTVVARRVTLTQVNGMEVELLDKNGGIIDANITPEEPVKSISIKVTQEIEGTKQLELIVDGAYANKKYVMNKTVNVSLPRIEVKDGGKDITEIMLYTKRPTNSTLVQTGIAEEDGKEHIYTLIPVSLMGNEGKIAITQPDIDYYKTQGKISVIDSNLDKDDNNTSALLIKTYKKASNGTYAEVTSNSSGNKEIDYIGIAVDLDYVNRPEDLEYIKLYYGNSTNAGVTLTVNPKVTKTNFDEMGNIEVTANQESKVDIAFYNGDKQVDIPARRVSITKNADMEVELLDKVGGLIDVTANPEEPVKAISIKVTKSNANKLELIIDSSSENRKYILNKTIDILSPEIEVNDGTNDITDITLYTQKPADNELVQVGEDDGYIYTLIPISVIGREGKMPISFSDIDYYKTEGKISVIDDKLNDGADDPALYLKGYHKTTEEGKVKYKDVTETNTEIDYIGIAMDTTIQGSDSLKYIYIYYGTDNNYSVRLNVNY